MSATIVTPISGLTPKATPAALPDLIEVSTPKLGGGYNTVSLTLQQVATLVLSLITAPGASRWVPGYGLQLFDTDPAQAAHPWRTVRSLNGVETLDNGVPDNAPNLPVLTAAAHAGSANNLTFAWTDPNYSNTGNLEVWKNGSALVTNLAPGATAYTDNGGIVGDSYKLRWNVSTFASGFSNAIVAA